MLIIFYIDFYLLFRLLFDYVGFRNFISSGSNFGGGGRVMTR
jgi:hypothetical protein